MKNFKLHGKKKIFAKIVLVGSLTFGSGVAYMTGKHALDDKEDALAYHGNHSLFERAFDRFSTPHNFSMIGIDDWSRDFNIWYHDIFEIPYGLDLNLNVTEIEQAEKEYQKIQEIIEHHDVTYPIVVDIDPLFQNKNLSIEQIYDILETFVNEAKKDNLYFGFKGKDYHLSQLQNFYPDLLRYVEFSGESYYRGNYDMMETKEGFVYSNYLYDHIIKKEGLNQVNVEDDYIHSNMIAKGIDVSSFQQEIDFDQLNVDFMIIRYGDFAKQENGSYYYDTYFERNAKECEKRDIPYGIYAVSRANDEKSAQKEAKAVLNAIETNQLSPEYPIYLDIEPDQAEHLLNLSSEDATKIIKAWLQEISKSGFTPAIYANTNNYKKLNEHTNQLFSYYDNWIADYGTNEEKNYNAIHKVDSPLESTNIHQCTSKGIIDGIEGHVDVNLAYTSYEKKQFPTKLMITGSIGIVSAFLLLKIYRKKKKNHVKSRGVNE